MLVVRVGESSLERFQERLSQWSLDLVASEMEDNQFRMWISDRLGPVILDMIADVTCRRVVTQVELRELSDVLDDAFNANSDFALTIDLASVPAYLDYRITLKEISSRLGVSTTDDFARRSAGHVTAIEGRRLRLAQLVKVIAHWVADVEDIQCALRVSVASTNVDPRSAAGSPLGPEELLTPDEVAAILKTSAGQVRFLIARGKLKSTNVGKGAQKPRYRIRRADVDAMVNSELPAAAPAEAKRPSRRRRLPDNLVDHFSE